MTLRNEGCEDPIKDWRHLFPLFKPYYAKHFEKPWAPDLPHYAASGLIGLLSMAYKGLNRGNKCRQPFMCLFTVVERS